MSWIDSIMGKPSEFYDAVNAYINLINIFKIWNHIYFLWWDNTISSRNKR